LEDLKELEFQRLVIVAKERRVKVEKDETRETLLAKLTSKPTKTK